MLATGNLEHCQLHRICHKRNVSWPEANPLYFLLLLKLFLLLKWQESPMKESPQESPVKECFHIFYENQQREKTQLKGKLGYVLRKKYSKKRERKREGEKGNAFIFHVYFTYLTFCKYLPIDYVISVHLVQD